ncbi:hypothetical protein [Agarivorans gilvus]|uniref:hypothetical protein n=2 Tax=Agarivorans gilvus TaxID=680279 RepID=UPI0006EC2043|nr:hypothetical protein [Agarivorans gilvus]
MAKNQFQCLSQRNKAKRDACLSKLRASEMKEVDLYVLHGPQFFALWLAKQQSQGLEQTAISQKLEDLGLSELAQKLVLTAASLTNQFAGQVLDVKTMGVLALDMQRGGSILGKYEITQNGAKSYISFKGNHKLRTLIKGTRYLSTNTKMLSLGIGQQGLKASARGGVLISVVFSVSHHTLELTLKQDYLLSNWVVDISADITKAAVSACLGFLFASAAAILTTVTIIPFAIGVTVAFAFNTAFNFLDTKYQISKKIIDSVNEYTERKAQDDITNLGMKIDKMKALNSMKTNGFYF